MKNTKRLTKVRPRLPDKDGSWADPGSRGNCDWMLDLDAPKPDIYSGEMPPPRVAWRQIIGQCQYPGADHVTFSGSFPVFDDYIVKITHEDKELDGCYTYPGDETMTGHRPTNFSTADNWVARYFGCCAVDVAELRTNHRLTWHEKEDTKTILLVPRAIHGFVPHSGGIDVVNSGGITGQSEYPSGTERKTINGETLCRVGDLALWRRAAGPEKKGYPAVSYLCLDAAAGPTPAQQSKAAELMSNWDSIFGAAQEQIAAYVQQVWSAEELEKGWDLSPKELILFPEHSWERVMTAGILCDSSLDLEHGLGVRLWGNGWMEAGPGDIAF